MSKSLSEIDIWDIAFRGVGITIGVLVLVLGYFYFDDIRFLQAMVIPGFFILVYVVCGIYDWLEK